MALPVALRSYSLRARCHNCVIRAGCLPVAPCSAGAPASASTAIAEPVCHSPSLLAVPSTSSRLPPFFHFFLPADANSRARVRICTVLTGRQAHQTAPRGAQDGCAGGCSRAAHRCHRGPERLPFLTILALVCVPSLEGEKEGQSAQNAKQGRERYRPFTRTLRMHAVCGMDLAGFHVHTVTRS